MDKISQFCQKCRAANEPGDTACRECGTRLMIVTFPKSLQHEEEIIPSYYEDHLLERVSLLELRVAQLTEQLAMGYEFISRQAETSEKDHLLMQTFFESLEKVNPELSNIFAKEFSDTYVEKKDKVENENRQKRIISEIVANHENPNTELFTHLIEEGIKLLKNDEEKQAFRTLKRAVLLSPKNVPLLVFIAKNLFRADKGEKAKEYLEKAYELSPQSFTTLLLLSVIYADDSEAEKARKLLSVLTSVPEALVFANYVWGMLAAFEGNWKESLAAFKESLDNLETPEMHYLTGCIYFQLENHQKALLHLEKAVLNDARFADAWFMQGIIYDFLDEKKKSANAKEMAFEAKEAGARCAKFFQKGEDSHLENALAFQHFEETNKHILTGNSLRLNRFLNEQIFSLID